MSFIYNLPEAADLKSAGETVLRQDGLDNRISLQLAETLAWTKRQGYTYLGEHAVGISFTNTESFTVYQGRVYFVKEGTSLPYITTSIDPSSEPSLKVLTEISQITEVVINPNLISNSGFEVVGSVTNPPDATPRSYSAGDELFAGHFALTDLVNVTYINGVINGDAALGGVGKLYVDISKSQKQQDSTSPHTASIAGSDLLPKSGASFVDNATSWRVTFDLSDTFSAKFEQGSVATGHELNYGIISEGSTTPRTDYERASDFVNVKDFGAIPNTDDDFGQNLQNASNHASNSGKKLILPQGHYKSSIPLDFDNYDVDFGGSTIEYIGPYKAVAVKVNGNALNQGRVARYRGLTVLNTNATLPDLTVENKTLNLPATAKSSVIPNIIGPKGVEFTFPMTGAQVGDMVFFEDFKDILSDGFGHYLTLTAVCRVAGVVTVTVSNWNQLVDFPGESVTMEVTAMHNPLHGLQVSGGNINVDAFRVVGFTGVSVAVGGGVLPVSGFDTKEPGGYCYYSKVDVNVASAFGYGMEIPSRNNVNTYKYNTWGYNLYNEQGGYNRLGNTMHYLICSGIGNNFTQCSLEGVTTRECMLVNNWATNNDFGIIYQEGDFESDLHLSVTSSSNKGRSIFKTPEDLGYSNEIKKTAINYVNSGLVSTSASSETLITNGTFNDGLAGWGQFGSATYIGEVDGPMPNTKAHRWELNGDTFNLQQNNALNVSGIFGFTSSALVKTDVQGVFCFSKNTSFRGSPSKGVGDWEHLTGFTDDDFDGSTEFRVALGSGVSRTGYIEVSCPTLVVGREALSYPKD